VPSWSDDLSERPSETDEPSWSDGPSQSGMPSESEEPSQSVIPSASEEPSQSGRPSESDEEPSQSGRPSESDDVTSQSGRPSESDDVTSQSARPSQSDVNESNSSHSASQSPEPTSKIPPTPTPTPEVPTTTSSSTRSILSVPSSVDFSRLTAKPTPTASQSSSSDETSVVLPQVIYNQAASACTKCLKFNIRIMAPYENLFGQNNYLASQAFNEVPDVVARAMSINYNRVSSTMIFATENAVVTTKRRALFARSEPTTPHYYMSLSVTRDSSVLNPKLELQQLATTMSMQIRDGSSALHKDGVWGSLIDSRYMKVTSDLSDLDGVAQVAPNGPDQVDSPFKGDAKSTSRSKWIGIGIAIFFAILIVILVVYWRIRHKKNKEKFRSNFVAIE
ncbi:hypothetical protein GGF45_002639, partial [Coemansia sp. RSA 551]